MSRQKVARLALPLYVGALYGTLGVVRPATEALREAGYLRATVAAIFATVAIAVTWAVFRDAASRRPRVALVLIAIVAAYAAVVLPMSSPEEKVHFIEYGGVALLAEAAAPGGWKALPRLFWAAAFTAAAGAIDEAIQGLLPSRYADWRDVGFNAAAGLMALAALGILRRFRRPGA